MTLEDKKVEQEKGTAVDPSIPRIKTTEMILKNIVKYIATDKVFAYKVIDYCLGDYFTGEVEKLDIVFNTIKTCFNKYNDLPTKNVTESEFAKEHQFGVIEKNLIDYIYDGYPIAEIEKKYIEEIIIDFLKQAKVREVVNNLKAEYPILDGEIVDPINIQNLNDKILKISQLDFDEDLGQDIDDDVDVMWSSFSDPEDKKLSTGYKGLDEILGGVRFGGWGKKTVSAVMAPSGVGKSIVLCNFSVKQRFLGKNVLHISLEIHQKDLGKRIYSIISQIPKNLFPGGEEEHKKIIKEALNNKKAGGKLKIKSFSLGAGINTNKIKSYIDDLKNRQNFIPDILVIDYGDLIAPLTECMGSYEIQGEAFANLNGLANDLNIPIVTASQCNRNALDDKGGTKPGYGINTIADSAKKVMILDNLFMIDETIEDKSKNFFHLRSEKVRDGISGAVVNFKINKDTQTIWEDFSIQSMQSGQTILVDVEGEEE